MRIKGLDFLRGVAVIGVLFRHFEMDFFLAGPGGYGVDLFFVLSGFLVSGLLFSEYRRRGKVNIARFLIRRGFKIYPAFYFFILTTILIFSYGFGSAFQTSAILSEVFFLQSYVGGIWSHTWSLAVEEHFYFTLALLVFMGIKFRWIEKRSTMPMLFLGSIFFSLLLRTIYVYRVYSLNHEAFFYSHLRIDGLFTGALIGYLYHFRKDVLGKFYRRKKLFAVLSLALILQSFFLKPGNLYMVTVGFNLMHLGFAGLILLLISEQGEALVFGNKILYAIAAPLSYIGVYSYSIYLWHLPVQNILLRYIPDLRIESAAYVTLSLVVGILASFAIERPMLRLRDRYFQRS